MKLLNCKITIRKFSDKTLSKVKSFFEFFSATMLKVSRSRPLIFTPKRQKHIMPLLKPTLQSCSQDFILKLQPNWKVVKNTQKKVLDDDKIEDITKSIIQYYTIRDTSTKRLIVKTQTLEKCQTGEIPQLFIRKCNTCCGFCDFSSEESDYSLKVLKTTLITELIDAIQSPKIAKVLTIECIQAFFKMFAANIFRPLINIPILRANDTAYDLEWMHLRVIYDIFTKFMYTDTIRPNFVANQIDDLFIHNLFQCIRFPDKREQKCACELLLAIAERYNFTGKVYMIEFSHFMSTASYDVYAQSSLNSLFDFFAEWTTIYKGKEWLAFFQNVLLPLMLLNNFNLFESSFTQVVCAFIRKNKLFVDTYIDHLFKHWPIVSPSKAKYYLNSLQTVIENFSRNISFYITVRLVAHISLLFNDCTSSLSQQSFRVSQTSTFLSLLSTVWNEIGVTVYNSAKISCNSHWNSETREMASKFLSSLESIDSDISKKEYSDCKRERESKWKQILNVAENNTKDKFLFIEKYSVL